MYAVLSLGANPFSKARVGYCLDLLVSRLIKMKPAPWKCADICGEIVPFSCLWSVPFAKELPLVLFLLLVERKRTFKRESWETGDNYCPFRSACCWSASHASKPFLTAIYHIYLEVLDFFFPPPLVKGVCWNFCSLRAPVAKPLL